RVTIPLQPAALRPGEAMAWIGTFETIVYCPECWAKRYLLRAVSMPVASPYGCTWDELRADLKLMWRETTRASNWLMTRLYSSDVRRNGEPKMPPMPKLYLYPALRQVFPALP